ncbi:MAG: hypothetical protein H6737_20435 [Alphaproteobacteria bacterium]|nr:hypothetical protein [Alphaproteobacteria bacterium]
MSSPFLISFVEAVVTQLVENEQIEIRPGETGSVVGNVAARLGAASEGESLVSTLVKALLACDAVEELYVDDMELKDLITSLPVGTLPRGGAR